MYSIEDRSQVITIGGVEHKLILTTKATKDITKRYGGLEKLGDKLLKNATMEESLGEVIWLIALLANQEILIHNLQHRDEPKPLLTEDEIELLTNPYELAEYKDAIMAAMLKARSVMWNPCRRKMKRETHRPGRATRSELCPVRVYRSNTVTDTGRGSAFDTAWRTYGSMGTSQTVSWNCEA